MTVAVNNYAPQPGSGGGACCCECHSSSLGDSAVIQNPITVNLTGGAIQIANGNPARKEIILVNTSSLGVVYVGLGYKPTITNYSFALTPCTTSNNDGTGGLIVSDIWTGPLYAIASVDGCTLNLTEQV